jgi:hypothetical protein
MSHEKIEKLPPPVKTLVKDYDSIYEQAGVIFNENNLCQWEKNKDGSLSCIVNRQNSKKNKSQFIDTDGCCINVCKHPKEHDDKIIKRKQHNNKKGCLVKSLKCRLHICEYLRKSNNPDTREAVKKLNLLINSFRQKYDILWTNVPFGSSKKICIEFYKMYKKNNRKK